MASHALVHQPSNEYHNFFFLIWALALHQLFSLYSHHLLKKFLVQQQKILIWMSPYVADSCQSVHCCLVSVCSSHHWTPLNGYFPTQSNDKHFFFSFQLQILQFIYTSLICSSTTLLIKGMFIKYLNQKIGSLLADLIHLPQSFPRLKLKTCEKSQNELIQSEFWWQLFSLFLKYRVIASCTMWPKASFSA